MNLLSVAETRNKRETLNATLESKSATLDEAIVAKRKELASLDEDFLRSIQNQRLVFLKEETEWNVRNNVLRTETEELERRKQIALIPLETREKELDTKATVLLQREQKIIQQEEEVTNKFELLESRLDEASHRLDSLQTREKQATKRENGIKMQEQQTNQRIAQFNELLTRTYSDIETQRLTLAKAKTEQQGREIALNERQKRLDSQENNFVSREIALVDKYKSLERAVEEMRNKNLIPKDYST